MKIVKNKPRGLHARDLLICFSFANLCYLRVWYEVESFDPTRLPAMKYPPTDVAVAGVMSNVTLLTLALTAIVFLFRRRPAHIGNWGRALFVTMLAVPAYTVYRLYGFHLQSILGRLQSFSADVVRMAGSTGILLLCAVAAAVFVWVVWRSHTSLARISGIALIALSPVSALTFAKGLWQICAAAKVDVADRPSPPPSPLASKQPRVIWLIFDEWDYRLTFEARQNGLALPEIDRLMQTAVSATEAIPPARRTVGSVPMLLTGERYQGERLNGPFTLEVSLVEEPKRRLDWSTRDLIFSAARAMNFNTALAGWYLPYCRVIGQHLNACEWQPMARQRNSVRTDSLIHAMTDQTRSLFETVLSSPFGQSLSTRRHALTYERLYRRAIEFMTDPKYGVVFVHIPIPHEPFFYDRATRQFSAEDASAPKRYYDALALLDRTVGEFRHELEAAGQWDRSTILFTTDHYFRGAADLDGKVDERVPFLLKLAGQTTPARYTRRFNTIVTKSLLLAVLRQDVRGPEDATGWIEQHGTTAEPLGAQWTE